MSWDNVSYIIRSRTRRSVLARLGSPKTPTALAHDLDTSIPNISRALRELQAKGLIQSLTPNARTGRLFVITEAGHKVLEKWVEIRERTQPEVTSKRNRSIG